MELWIRSKDKMKLIRVIVLGIFEEQEGYTIYYDDSIDNMLGTYATKERALEVLDEIQSIIIGKYMCDINLEGAFSKIENEEDIEKLLKQMAVYEMPKDWLYESNRYAW